MELRCQIESAVPMVGYAVTCTCDNTSPSEPRPRQLDRLIDLLAAAPKPAVLVIRNAGPECLRSCFVGDMLCTAIRKLGVEGVVADGGYRDKAGIERRAPGFHFFSPGPVVSHGQCAFLEFNVAVSICGLTIQPGDLLHGDANGLLTIPLEVAESLARKARAVYDEEAEFFRYLAGNEFSVEGLKARFCPPQS